MIRISKQEFPDRGDETRTKGGGGGHVPPKISQYANGFSIKIARKPLIGQ